MLKWKKKTFTRCLFWYWLWIQFIVMYNVPMQLIRSIVYCFYFCLLFDCRLTLSGHHPFVPFAWPSCAIEPHLVRPLVAIRNDVVVLLIAAISFSTICYRFGLDCLAIRMVSSFVCCLDLKWFEEEIVINFLIRSSNDSSIFTIHSDVVPSAPTKIAF